MTQPVVVGRRLGTDAQEHESGVVKAAPDAERHVVSLWVRLLESHNLVVGEVRRRLSGVCTMPRFDLLANLEREDGQTLAALSRRMLVTAGNLTGLVDRAERDGVVERRADPRDRRLSRVYLTPRGRDLITGLLPKHAEHIGELLEGLDAADRRELRRLLGKLRDGLVARLVDNYRAGPSAGDNYRAGPSAGDDYRAGPLPHDPEDA
jgi:DNA-binding MarR family transcriptional regulator